MRNRIRYSFEQPKGNLWLAIALIAFCSGACLETASAEGDSLNAPAKAPHWIWNSAKTRNDSQVFFRRDFQVESGLIAAKLRLLADYHDLRVFVNGELLANLQSYSPQLQLDVTGGIRGGSNRLALFATKPQGPAAIAIELILKFQDGHTVRIFSDTSWQCARHVAPGWELLDSSDKNWSPVVDLGPVSRLLWSDTSPAITEVDDYTQWKQAIGAPAGSDPSTFFVAKGFQIERLKSASTTEGSWVSLAFDPKGRIVVAREDRGLLRMTLSSDSKQVVAVETIDDSLLECRGLLFAHGSLYVNANNSKGLYRLRDTNSDGQFDETKLLYQSGGGVGHGRNDLALGPDGVIYSIQGDAVDLPTDCLDLTSPFTEHRRGKKTNEGHVISLGPSGKDPILVLAGLRNPYGIAFNTDGEMFTYDADAEYDMGAPWYRPTRVRHLVSGADYGWRGVTRQWPPYYPDHPGNPPSNLDVGKGSPTAVLFGTKSRFPEAYRRALFILDWAYGRILAVHIIPRGSSYLCRAETIIKGQPLNVTDLAFGPDGAMYIITGGRKTQSAMYRIRAIGRSLPQASMSGQQLARHQHATKSRQLRRSLEAFHGRSSPSAVATAWPFLSNSDPWIRQAARIAIEHQPVRNWRNRAMAESNPLAGLTAVTSLSHASDAKQCSEIIERIIGFTSSRLPRAEKLLALHAYSICMTRGGATDEQLRLRMLQSLGPLYPDHDPIVTQTLSKLLAKLNDEQLVRKTIPLLLAADNKSEKLQYLFVLRSMKLGWSDTLRGTYFQQLAQAKGFQGGDGMPQFLKQIERDAIAVLSDRDKELVRQYLEPSVAASEFEIDYATRTLVKKWELSDLTNELDQVKGHPIFADGKLLFSTVLCARCHRVAGEGSVIGPDLTAIASRFGRRDILQSILSPSRVVAEQYQTDVLVTRAGKILTGRIAVQTDYRSPHLQIALDALRPFKLTTIAKVEIESHNKSANSMMPRGLLDTLTPGQVQNLLAYLLAGGNKRHPIYTR